MKLIENKKHIILVLAFALFACTTSWNTHKQSHLQPIPTIQGQETFAQQDSIHIVAKAYSAEESKKYVRKNLLKYGYQPVQITIQNNSREELSLSTGSVDLPTASPSSIAKKVMLSALPRGIILRAASFVFWPMMIPSYVDSVITLKSYKIIKHDLESKLVKKEVIAPYSIYNRIVFVPIEQFTDRFSINLIELRTLKTKTILIEGLETGKSVEASSFVSDL